MNSLITGFFICPSWPDLS